jgi:hypothetical protein
MTILDETVRVSWKKPGHDAHYEDGKDIAHALRLRKDFILSDLEYKIAIMKYQKWVTITESKGWEE